MADCTSDLQLYDDHIQTCDFSPSSGSDVHNFWYSPFHADGAGVGHSGAYKLPLTGGSSAPTQVSRTDFSAAPPTVQCDDNIADPISVCVKVQNNEQTQLAAASGQATRPGDFSDGVTYDDTTCTGGGKRWITGATAFAPPPGAQGRATYEVRGCALKCADPSPTLAALQMEEVGVGTKSFDDNFSVQVKCRDNYGPTQGVFPGNERDMMVGTGTGMDATKCTVEGTPYTLNYTDAQGSTAPVPPCVRDCALATGSSTALSHQGYDLVATSTGLDNNVSNLGMGLNAAEVSSHLVCSAGYTLRPGDAVSPCNTPGGPIVINDETVPANLGGCIADCKPSASPAFNWLPDGTSTPTTHDFHTSTDHFKWQDTGDVLERSAATNTSPITFSCPAGYESGPGSDPSFSPTYESCGNLPGHVNSMSADSVATRSTYGLTGCYPICPSGLCYNYKTEKQIDLSAGNPLQGGEEESWRTQMGQMLNDHTSWLNSPLDETNISFVRRQVLNNGADMTTGKEILEWQIKCSDQQCTNDPTVTDRINIDNILGQDGIPAPLQEWNIGEPGDTCTETCRKAGNPGCTDGDWGITDESSFTTTGALDVANCTSYQNMGWSEFQPFITTSRDGSTRSCGYTLSNQVTGNTTCDAVIPDRGLPQGMDSVRVCKCDLPPPAGPTAPTAPAGQMSQYTSDQAESGARFANCDAQPGAGQRGRHCPCSDASDCYSGATTTGSSLSGQCDSSRTVYVQINDAVELARVTAAGWTQAQTGWDFDDGQTQCR